MVKVLSTPLHFLLKRRKKCYIGDELKKMKHHIQPARPPKRFVLGDDNASEKRKIDAHTLLRALGLDTDHLKSKGDNLNKKPSFVKPHLQYQCSVPPFTKNLSAEEKHICQQCIAHCDIISTEYKSHN